VNAEQHARFYEEVQADIARLEAELEELRAVANYHRLKAGLGNATSGRAETTIAAAEERTSDAKPGSGPFSSIKQVRAAEIVLRESSKPLRTSEIARRLIEGGYPALDAARLKTSLFTTMTRKKDVFVKAGVGLWTVPTRPGG